MIRGERAAINLQASLLPHQNNVVRVSRHNAKVDEGLNYVVVLNETEFYKEYGNMVEICPSSCNGESYVVIHNYTDHVLSLPAGKLRVGIRPAIALPSVLTPASAEFQSVRDNMSADEFLEDVAKTAALPVSTVKRLASTLCKDSVMFRGVEWDRLSESTIRTSSDMPLTFVSWNMNSLRARLQQENCLQDFHKHIMSSAPDVIALQEVKLGVRKVMSLMQIVMSKILKLGNSSMNRFRLPMRLTCR